MKIKKDSFIPRYQQLKGIILREIKTNKLKPGDQVLSEPQLCKKYNISRITVGKAMSELANEGMLFREPGKGTFVEKTKIDKEINIQILCDNSSSSPTSNPMYWFVSYYILQGVIAACEKFNCRPSFIDYRSGKISINKAKEVIFIGESLELIKEVKAKAHFMVISYYPRAEIQCSNVIADWEKAAYDGVQHLLKLGHKKVGLLDVEEAEHSEIKVYARSCGYKKALEEKGIFSEQLVKECSNNEESINNAVFSLLNHKDRPTAIFAVNDFRALGAIKAIQERGLRVPEDIAVVGYNDIPEASTSVPSLTTLHIPRYECGYESVRLLKQLIKGEKKEPQTIVLPGRLVIRESCGTYLKNNKT